MVVLLPGRYVGWIEREVLGLCLDTEPRVILGDLDSSDSSVEKNSVGRRLAAYLGIKSAGSGLRLLGICRTPRCPPKQFLTPWFPIAGISLVLLHQHPYNPPMLIPGSQR